MTKLPSAYLMCVLLLAMPACGGGDDGGGVSGLGAWSFSGTYWFLLMGATSSGPSAESAWGTAVANGTGNVQLTATENDNGAVNGPFGQALTYTVAPDGILTLFSAGTEVARGGISADSSCGLLASSTTLDTPFIIVLTKAGGTFSAASLSGDYHVAGYSVDGGPESLFSTKVTFDGVSAFSGTGASNNQGALDGGPVAGTYTVAGDGTSTFDFFARTSRGCLLEGSTLAIYGGGDTNGDDPSVFALLQAGTGLTEATVVGPYWIVGLEYDLGGGPNYSSFYGTVFADGAGGSTVAGTAHDETTLTPFTGPVGYTVAGDGTVVVNRGGIPGTEDVTGAVTPDGRFVIAGGGAVGGSNTVLFVLCRK